jgi:hypothetical protein
LSNPDPHFEAADPPRVFAEFERSRKVQAFVSFLTSLALSITALTDVLDPGNAMNSL